MAERRNGLVWDAGKSPQQVFRNAAERYAAALNDQTYRMAVTHAPSMQDVLQNVGSWDDNRAEGGDMIRVAAFRMSEDHSAGLSVWYNIEDYRVQHPREDPDYDWIIKHIESRGEHASRWVVQLYNEGVREHEQFNRTVDSAVDDRVVETFYDEARLFWDTLMGTLR